MTWSWRFENDQGVTVKTPVSESFLSKSDAESWLGEVWRDLLEKGVFQVTLMEDDRVEYGPMGLQAPD